MKYIWAFCLVLAARGAGPAPVVWMNVMLHGGGMDPRYYSIRDFFKTLQGLEENSVYAEATKIIRTDPFFYFSHPVQGMGLVRAFPIKPQGEPNAAYVFGKLYQMLGNMIDPHFPRTLQYTFGWNGLLSIKGRHDGARELAREVGAELVRLHKAGIFPKVRIWGYSHGGNAALCLASIAHEKPLSFVVDELVLLATPVQESSVHLLKSPLFKKIFLFYSAGDYVQATDFLSSYTHSFAKHSFAKPTANLTQVQIRFLRKTFATDPKNLGTRMRTRRSYINPGHVEMFFFGWTADWYREFFPIKPLPVGLLIPFFERVLAQAHLEGHHVLATIKSDEHVVVLTVRPSQRVVEVPFLSEQQLIELKRTAWQYEPFDYRHRYQVRLRQVRKEAQQNYKNNQAAVRAKKRACAVDVTKRSVIRCTVPATCAQNHVRLVAGRAVKVPARSGAIYRTRPQ